MFAMDSAWDRDAAQYRWICLGVVCICSRSATAVVSTSQVDDLKAAVEVLSAGCLGGVIERLQYCLARGRCCLAGMDARNCIELEFRLLALSLIHI